jgi:hypothetical protein
VADVTNPFGVAPLEFTRVEAAPYSAEYAVRPSNETVFHFFAERFFPDDFSDRLSSAFRTSWAPGARFEVTFEPELKSYCVIMRHGFVMKPPPQHFSDFITKVLKE